MRLGLIAVAMALAWVAGMSSAEAREYRGHKGDRYERSHAHWNGRRAYSGRYAQRADRRYTRRQYAHRKSASRYAYRSSERRRYAYSGRAHRQYYGQRRYAQRHYSSGRRRYASAGGVGGRPRAWCGWWMRTQLGGGPEYNLAANWRHYGRPSGPRVGAVVVWPHHVGMITGRSANGQWIVKSGNDGNRVRERPMSVAGAVFRTSG
ncbi:hypothetical protein RLW55_05750 [Hyphomicrobium sp. B1]|uniref:hypothetical protein n=1 Tax=unclassified Hyphomicrobium TaxID=2619925 RepID=UPI00391DF9DE